MQEDFYKVPKEPDHFLDARTKLEETKDMEWNVRKMAAQSGARYLQREARAVFFFKEVGNNLKAWGGDTFETYVNGPLQKKDYVSALMGTVAAGCSAVLEGTDYLIAGVVDKPLQPASGLRIGRDAKAFGVDLASGSLLKAGADVLRLPGSAAMDVIDTIGGFRHGMKATLHP